jgi:sec-independent protein translocase protein TatA
MFGIGLPALAVILVIVLLVFGSGKLPEVGKALGLSIKNFKAGSEGKDPDDPKA